MDNSGKENVKSKSTPGIKNSEIWYTIKREGKQIIGTEEEKKPRPKV